MTESPSTNTLEKTVDIYAGSSLRAHHKTEPAAYATVMVRPDKPEEIVSGAAPEASDVTGIIVTAINNGLAKCATADTITLHTDCPELDTVLRRYIKNEGADRKILRELYAIKSPRMHHRTNYKVYEKLFKLLSSHQVSIGDSTAMDALWITKADEQANAMHDKLIDKSKNFKATADQQLRQPLQLSSQLNGLLLGMGAEKFYDPENIPAVEIHTDGTLAGDKGGWAAVLVYPEHPNLDATYYGNSGATADSGSSETRAITEALKILQTPHNVKIFTDRTDLVRVINGFADKHAVKPNPAQLCNVTQNRPGFKKLIEELKRISKSPDFTICAEYEKSHGHHEHHNAAHKAAEKGRNTREGVMVRVDAQGETYSMRTNPNFKDEQWKRCIDPQNLLSGANKFITGRTENRVKPAVGK